MSEGLRWLWATREEGTDGVAGKRSKTAKLGMSAHDRLPCSSASFLRSAAFVRYAEVLIDVRAHTETIVNSEPPNIRSVSAHACTGQVSCARSSSGIAIDDDTRSRLIQSLGSWHFEPHKLPEEEVLACTYILFEALFRVRGMEADVGVTLGES